VSAHQTLYGRRAGYGFGGVPTGPPKGSARQPPVRASLRHLDLIALLPVSDAIPARPHEDPRFRKRVDERLRRALIDDDFDLFDDRDLPRVVELSALPARQIAELMRLTEPEK